MADEYVLKKNVIDALISDKVEITDVHRAIGGERDFEVLNVTCDRHADMVMALPAADVRPVRRGRWLNVVSAIVDTTGNCSECRKEAVWRTRNKPYTICPNCGADMREG